MDIGTFILINVAALSALAIATPLLWRVTGSGGWIAINVAVLAVAGLSYGLNPAFAPWLTLAVFVPFVLVPGILSNLAARRALANDMPRAARYAGLAARLAPGARAKFHAAMLAAMSEPDTDRRATALHALAGATPDPANRTLVEMHAARARDDWPAIARLAEPPATLTSDSIGIVLRALGEVGRVEDMFHLYRQRLAELRGLDLSTAHLFLAAFSGAPETVERMITGPLSALNTEVRDYWRAIARLSQGGDISVPRSNLKHLSATTDNISLRRAALRHLEQEQPASPIALSSGARDTLRSIDLRHANASASRVRSWRDCPLTLLLLAVMLFMYALSEWSGGSQDIDVLINLGAVDPVRILDHGEWWRLAASLFLHYGLLHLLANGVLLALAGSSVEVRHGSFALGLTFFAGGIIAGAVVLMLIRYGSVRYGLLVGASGAIFAVIAFELMARLLAWQSTRDPLDRREIFGFASALAVQLAVDLLIPEISLAAHLTGMIAGGMIGLVWYVVRFWSGPRQPR